MQQGTLSFITGLDYVEEAIAIEQGMQLFPDLNTTSHTLLVEEAIAIEQGMQR